MTKDQIADAMISFIDQRQDYKENIDYLFNFSDNTIDWGKGKQHFSAASHFGTLRNFFMSYLTELKISSANSFEIEQFVDYAYWRLLYPTLLSIYIKKKGNVHFTGTTNTNKYTFAGAGEKYHVVWAGLKETSFCAWGGNYTHIKFRVTVPQKGQYSYSSHKTDLLSLNVVSVVIEFNGHRQTVKATIPTLTAKNGLLTTTASALLDTDI